MSARLNQRGEDAEDAADEPHVKRQLLIVAHLHPLARKQRLLKVALNTQDLRVVVHHRTSFKVVIKASVVKVHRAHRGDLVVAHEVFGVDEAWQVQVDVHAAFHERFKEGATHTEGDEVVVPRGDDHRNLDAPLHHEGEGLFELVVDDDVGRGDVNISLCFGKDIKVDVLCDVLFIVSIISVGDHDAACAACLLSGREVLCAVCVDGAFGKRLC